jgi:putative acetyltransferase
VSGITVRQMRHDEARMFLELHSRSIRGLAAAHYSPAVIEAWTVPLTDDNLARFVENVEKEMRLIAEIDGEPVGLGALVVANCELRACYVVPEAARKGVGTALVHEIERIARENDVSELELLASLNAEPFYASLGYIAQERTELLMRGQPMAAVRMSKRLGG